MGSGDASPAVSGFAVCGGQPGKHGTCWSEVKRVQGCVLGNAL